MNKFLSGAEVRGDSSSGGTELMSEKRFCEYKATKEVG